MVPTNFFKSAGTAELVAIAKIKPLLCLLIKQVKLNLLVKTSFNKLISSPC